MSESVVIHWFRRDLRLADNLALDAALRSGSRVLPLFILDPAILGSPRTGAPRVAFMLKALAALDGALRALGGRLAVRHGDPRAILPQLVRAVGARAVYANSDYSPYARRRDGAVAAALDAPLHTFDDVVLRAPGSVLKPDGAPYVVYTPFKQAWRAMPDPSRPLVSASGRASWQVLPGEGDAGLPNLSELGFEATIDLPEASESAASRALERFVAGPIYAYGTGRNSLTPDPFRAGPGGTSLLSPYLRLGMLSPRQAYWAARAALDRAPGETARRSVEAWIDELIWREFYVHILYHFPHVERASFRPAYDGLRWRLAPDDLAAWLAGQTGYPVVDAAMRQLHQIGWMPNRARMIVASFLTKDLLIDWRAGEQHFMQWLIDGDPAANNGGWQWAAGTGTDAQPYFRIFNPVAQGEKFDPDGAYVRRWVPELRGVPTQFIHAPWRSPAPPRDYPPPIVDHALARERALAAFKAVRA